MAATKRRRAKPVPRHLITTPPRNGQCSKCHRKVLQGMIYGEPSSLEPVHLSLLGEAKALVMGIWTYNVTTIGDGHPFPRAVYHIRDGLPEHSYIVPAHRCGVFWCSPGDLDTREVRRYYGVGHVPDECPF